VGRRIACLLLLLALAAPPTGCGGDQGAAPPPPIGRFPADRFYVQKDLFIAADEPATVPAREAGFLKDDDEVFGIVVAGRARAYPTTMISYHHVVNDVIQGIPVAVTY
jgi:hypothetical protein